MKLQRWKIKLNEFDYKIKYLPGKENHIADALSRVKLNENFLGETNSNTAATIHSAHEDNENYISITERPLNYYNRQLEFIKGIEEKVDITKYFHKTNIKITYKEMSNAYAKDIIKQYLCSKNNVIYFHNEQDFPIFQQAYVELIHPNNITKTMKSNIILSNLLTYAEFKEIILKNHKELLHPGIEKTINWFREKFYFPDYQHLIQNIINECVTCNLAKTENRNTKLTFEITPEIYNVREKYIMDFYMIDNLQFLSCIDIYSKFATLIEVKSRDWLEAKRAIMRIFNDLGKPIEIKADKDSAFICAALQNWLKEENVKIDITTSKNGIADVERFHRTVNEKLRIINNENNIEDKLTKFEKILYTYNHKTTNRTPADIFIYAGTPEYNTQLNKISQITDLNKNRHEYEINTKYRQAPLVKSKTTNPFKKTGIINQLDEKHYEEINRVRKVTHHKSKYKKKKKINNSKYDN